MKKYLKHILPFFLTSFAVPIVFLIIGQFSKSFQETFGYKFFWLNWLVALVFCVLAGTSSYFGRRDYEKQREIRKFFLVDMAYRNYKGEHGTYLIYPLDVRFGSNDFHKTPQWMLIADKYNPNDLSEPPKRRTFAMQDITKIGDIVNKDYK